MPLFQKSWDNQPIREPEPLPPSPPPKKRTGLFGSRRSVDGTSTRRTDTGHTNGNTRHSPTDPSSGGFFSRRRSSDTSSDRSFERSGKEESSILAARQKVADAENAESLAADALKQAAMPFAKRRNTSTYLKMKREKSEWVSDCNCCKRVSYRLSASPSARRAKLKQKEARAVGKSLKNLGRYGQ
jgi:hypothetical protein